MSDTINRGKSEKPLCASERAVVTVDGLAGSGKSTLAKLLAERLQFAHLNSGLLYRAVAWLAKKHGISPTDSTALVRIISEHQITLVCDAELKTQVSIDAVFAGSELQEPIISDLTSKLSVHAEVRAALIDHQRQAFLGKGLVAEGRDMGTIIFPQAPVKFFVTASQAIRIQRRLQQLYGATVASTESSKERELMKKNVEIEIVARDKRDQERSVAPTKAAADAVIIDNSADPLTSVVERMYTACLLRGVGV